MNGNSFIRRFTLLLGLCCISPQVSAQQTVELANGDRLSGRLRRIENGTWVFRFQGADVSFAGDSVTAFTAPAPIGVRLADGTIAAVTIEPVGQQLLLEFEDDTRRRIPPTALLAVGRPDDLEALRPLEIGLFTPFFEFWRASGSLGLSDKRGNSRARGVSTSLEVGRRSPKDRIRLVAGFTREQSPNAEGELESTVSKSYAGLRSDVFFTRRFFVFAETRQERDTFQDIALRSTYNGGLGLQVVATERTDFSISASGGVRVEQFVADGSETAAVLKPAFALRQHVGPVTLDWELGADSNVEQLRDSQFRSQVTFTTQVYKGLGFRVGILNEFDNVPRPGVEKHDMLVTTTLAYSIGGS